jgi:hypothetical protein
MRQRRMWIGARAATFLGFILTAMTMGAAPAQANAAVYAHADVQRSHVATSSSWYLTHLINYGSRRCMGTEGGRPSAGTKIVQWDCFDNHNDQFWWVNPDGGYHDISNFVLPDTGIPQCLALAGGNTIIGWQLEIYNCNGADDQQWRFTPHGSSWVIWNKKSPNLVIAVSGGRTDNGAPVELYYWQAHPDQSWIIPGVVG